MGAKSSEKQQLPEPAINQDKWKSEYEISKPPVKASFHDAILKPNSPGRNHSNFNYGSLENNLNSSPSDHHPKMVNSNEMRNEVYAPYKDEEDTLMSPKINHIDFEKERVRVVSKGSALPTQTSIDAEMTINKNSLKKKKKQIEPTIISFEVK